MKKRVYALVFVLGFLTACLLLVLIVLGTQASSRSLEPMTTRSETEEMPVYRDISFSADQGKPGEIRSVMGQLLMRQDARTTGVSPDTLRFRFDREALVYGVMVSVDILHLNLVEVVVGINQPSAYGVEARDWLIHTSDSGGRNGSKSDEHVWFPEPFVVGPDDYVGVGAWLRNEERVERAISPEVIIYYQWQGN